MATPPLVDEPGREQLLRDRLRHPGGAHYTLWPVDTDIPDTSVFYTACFAVPHGDRAFLHFQHQDKKDKVGVGKGGGGGGEKGDDANSSRLLEPLLFVYNRHNSNNQSVAASRIFAVAAVAAASYAPGPLWYQTDTILTGILAKTVVSQAADGGDPVMTFVVDDVLQFRGARCCDTTGSLAERAEVFYEAIMSARQIPGRRFQIVPVSHKRAPLPQEAAGSAVVQWLPEPWTPPYATKVFQLRDLTAVRPNLNLRLNDWTATWDAPIAVAGSGVTADSVSDDEEEDADAAAKKKRRRRVPPLVPMDLNPHNFGGSLAHLLLERCPVYRGPAVFVVQADPGMADIYRLFCMRSGGDRGSLETAMQQHNLLSANEEEEDDDTLFRDHLQFYQLAMVRSFELSVHLNVWFRHVPEQERFAWTAIGAPPEVAEALPPALRNENGRRVLLFVCTYDVGRSRWTPMAQVPFADAYRVVSDASLVVPGYAPPQNEPRQFDRPTQRIGGGAYRQPRSRFGGSNK